MKKFFNLVSLFFLAFQLIGQAPQTINYQAVARKPDGNPIVGGTINLSFRILEGGPNGTQKFSETQNGVSVNNFGLFTTQIGKNGGLSSIDWSTGGSKWLEVVINNDQNLKSSQELVSVPYALYAEKSKPSPITHVEKIQSPDPKQETQRSVELPVPGTQITVPEAGTYLILANLGATATSGDSGLNGFVKLLVTGGTQTIFDFRVQAKPNGQLLESAAESSSWGVATNLKQGDVLRLDFSMGSWVTPHDSTPFKVTRGKLILVKLN